MSEGRDGEPRSYWHATAAPPIPGDELPEAADVVVVGGGLVGCWTAYWLARAGASPLLVERTAIGWGATGRNGGFLRSGLSEGLVDASARVGREAASAIWRLSREGHDLVRETLPAEGIACDYREPGTIHLALDDAASLEEIRREAALAAEEGVACEVLDRQGVQAYVATPLGEEIAGGLLFPDGGLLHSSRYLAGVAAAARRHGARLALAGVERLTPSGDGVLVETTRGVVRAGRVVVAVNAWTDELVPTLAGTVVPVRGQILSYAPMRPVFSVGLGASVTPTGEYWQQTPDGAIVLGGCRAAASGGDVGVREPVPTPGVTAAIEGVFPRLFSELAGLAVERRWAGLMAFTSDYLPVADAAPGLPGVWVAGGFCGHGMPYGPRLGQLLAEAAATGVTPAALAPLRVDRPTLSPLAVPA